MPIMRVNRVNMIQLTQKKTKVVTKAKTAVTVTKAGSSPQAHVLPMPNMNEKVTTNTVATIATGKG